MEEREKEMGGKEKLIFDFDFEKIENLVKIYREERTILLVSLIENQNFGEGEEFSQLIQLKKTLGDNFDSQYRFLSEWAGKHSEKEKEELQAKLSEIFENIYQTFEIFIKNTEKEPINEISLPLLNYLSKGVKGEHERKFFNLFFSKIETIFHFEEIFFIISKKFISKENFEFSLPHFIIKNYLTKIYLFADIQEVIIYFYLRKMISFPFKKFFILPVEKLFFNLQNFKPEFKKEKAKYVIPFHFYQTCLFPFSYFDHDIEKDFSLINFSRESFSHYFSICSLSHFDQQNNNNKNNNTNKNNNNNRRDRDRNYDREYDQRRDRDRNYSDRNDRKFQPYSSSDRNNDRNDRRGNDDQNNDQNNNKNKDEKGEREKMSKFHQWRFAFSNLNQTNNFSLYNNKNNYNNNNNNNNNRNKNYNNKEEEEKEKEFEEYSKSLKIITKGNYYNEIDVIVDHFQEEERLKGRRKEQKKSFFDQFFTFDILFKLFFDLFNEKKNFNSENIREKVYLMIKECTQFKPSIVAAIIQKFNAKKMIDFSSGWGDRLAGAISENISYLGFDPNLNLRLGHSSIISTLSSLPKKNKNINQNNNNNNNNNNINNDNIKENNKMNEINDNKMNEINENNNKNNNNKEINNNNNNNNDNKNEKCKEEMEIEKEEKYKVIYEPIETAKIPENSKFDLVFTSPPFFDFEIYTSLEGQSISSFPKIDDWLVHFLFVAIEKCWRHLDIFGYFALHIADIKDIPICEPMNLFMQHMLKGAHYRGVIIAAGKIEIPIWIWQKMPFDDTFFVDAAKYYAKFYYPNIFEKYSSLFPQSTEN